MGSVLPALVKPHFLVEADRPSVRDQHVLMEAFVFCHQPSHQLRSDTFPLKFGIHQKVRIIHNEMTVRDGIAQSDKTASIPGR